MKSVSDTGLPVNRPLWFDFPEDENCSTIDDQYMFGPRMMVAPVYTYQARNRTVYFPSGTSWTHYFTKKKYEGGHLVVVDAPLNNFPLFIVSENKWGDLTFIPPYVQHAY